ncbi:unnamed protein product [Kuraishia capsulata CBS 1993]|uniref:U3 small nucleolar RNA-associated protein 22 n=1 Tax=Kuraishia capsulata CBS 1993 TaxID=1382522 RepID=W6MRE9_9ASCO|nr:uncharacterized protein KUCA_T00005272001 [Kuraishia capsulata CBS 1993]CDK29284.1 unnamed protein product [Kuraishia capsulata CBS 1993]
MAKRSRNELAADGKPKAVASSASAEEATEVKVVTSGALQGDESMSGAEISEQEEGESSESEEEEDEQAPQSKRTKPQLAAQDVQIAREAAELFKSNIFKMEIDELLNELRLKESHVELVERVLHRLHDVIRQVPETGDLTLAEAEEKFVKGKHGSTSIPFPDPKPSSNINYKFKYLSPEDISLVGSFGLKTGVQRPGKMVVDVALTMPQSLLQPKDYLNYRAIYKRAFYLAHLASHLTSLCKKNRLPVKLSYEFLNGDVLCPCLKIEPINPEKKHEEDLIFTRTKISIRILVGFEFGIFEGKKLLPDRNCIRVQQEHKSEDLPPTPLYNSSVLTSCTFSYYLKYLYTNKKSAEAFRDAAVLGKVWLAQHGFKSHIQDGGFGHFEFAILMAALLQGGGENGNKILLHGFSSYQLFKGTIKYLATQDLCHDGYLSFTSLIGDHNSIYKKEGFNVPTIFDKNTKLNILWKMSRSSYEALKKQAQEALRLLNDVVKDRFRDIFILNSTDSNFNFDLSLSLPVDRSLEGTLSFGSLEKIQLLTFENFLTNKIFKLVHRALGDRISEAVVSVESGASASWSLQRRKPSDDSKTSTVHIGLYLNPQEADKRVTRGPALDDKVEGERFASFWQSRAQVRKFKDGTIQYSCLWSPPPDVPVIVNILQYVFQLHLSSELSDALEYSSKSFTKLLPKSSVSLPPATLFQNLKNSFDALAQLTLDMDLPLRVKSVSPASTQLRNASIIPAVPYAIGNPDFFNDVVIQLETSVKWPDELYALENTKTAFLLKIHENLQGHDGYRSYVTRPLDSVPYNKAITQLRILTPQGYGFSFKILTERDETLYLRAVENGEEKQKTELQKVYISFQQHYIASVKHHRTVNRLMTRYPALSGTVRLFKHWLDSQLLLSHFSEPLIELIALKPFVDASPYPTPNGPEVGFLRILQFLSLWNWREDPLVLDFSDQTEDVTSEYSDRLSLQTFQLINNNFQIMRKQDPSGLNVQFFVGSRDDLSGKLWSSYVHVAMATRLTALSKAAVGLLKNQTGKLIEESVLKLLFTPALEDYDFVIRVKTEDNSTSSGCLATTKKETFKNLVNVLSEFPETPKEVESARDPTVEYTKELNKVYENSIIFSSNRYSGPNAGENVITGLYNPVVVQGEKKFKVGLDFNFKPSGEGKVLFNNDAVLNEIITMGGDLVKGFESK